ncbi:MAG: T9SS type A sorting domain-containing protein [Crocinitomicaceae bacterium]|nr:MAG: T9SS type A sorting domain-containing protein [Crocinitomicaceae bacterium]
MKWIWIIFSVAHIGALTAQDWTQLANFPGDSRDDASVFQINERVYCGLGLNAGFSCMSDFHVFDLVTETWSDGVNLPTGNERQYATGFAFGGKGYIFGGTNSNGDALRDFWKFDPSLGAWTPLPEFPGLGKSGAMSFVIEDTAYIVGGKTVGGVISDEVWAFNLVSELWTQKMALPIDGVWRGVSFSTTNFGIIGLGKMNSGMLNPNFYRYSAASNSWELVSQLPIDPVTYPQFSQIGSLGFIYGGVLADQSYSNRFFRIELDTWQIQELANFPAVARKGGVAFAGPTTFYMATGVSLSGRLQETWKATSVLATEIIDSAPDALIYPNPTANAISIQSNAELEFVEVYDLAGTLVYRKDIDATNATIEFQLQGGIYTVVLTTDKRNSVHQLVVVN